jgi:hypothetical protein
MTETKPCKDAIAEVVVNGERVLMLVRPVDDGLWQVLLPLDCAGTLTEVLSFEPLFAPKATIR